MATSVIQYSFHAGEWAPALNARVDLAKYDSAAALLENFFVDYRGGASSRPGTQYVIQAWKSNFPVRLIPFQASFQLGYMLEFGDFYIRFIRNGAPVLETPKNITGITQANPGVVTVIGHGFVDNDVVFIEGVNGMTPINGKYYFADVLTPDTFALHDLSNVNFINTTGYPAYTSGGTAARVYKIDAPYAGADLAGLKFTQNVDQLIICHPDYVPYVLTFIAETNWTIAQIAFGTSINPPTPVNVGSTIGAGNVNYAYIVTSVDESGQESVASPAITLSGNADIRTTPGSIDVIWTPVAGAAFYNLYKAQVSYGQPVPAGAAFGYIGFATGTQFIDSNISADFSQTPQIAQNPFSGAGVVSYTVTVPGVYTSVPFVTVASSGGVTSATAIAELQVQGTPTVAAGGAGYAVNDTITLDHGVVVVVNTVAAGVVTSYKAITVAPSNPGAITFGATPANPRPQTATSGAGAGATVNLVWGVGRLIPVSSGAGYTSPPAVSFSPVGASATAILGPASDLNPSVPGFFQQRLVLGALAGAPQTFYMSQSGAPFNFNITNPIQPDNAISAALVAGQLNTIKSMVAMPSGLVLLTDRAVWLVSGGSVTESLAVSPSNISANPHSYSGASDVPPIVANFDILYVQAKGSIVRDLAYNIYSNIYTGTDISVLSSHLFYGYEILEWAWAEEPFKIVWAVRNDGVALSLTFLKEQELIGWCHSTTGDDEGDTFESVASTIEATDFGNVDAVYFVVQRTVNGLDVKYIERLTERIYPNGAEDAWCVDAGVRYVGAPATTFSGADHLAGRLCTGLADGSVIEPFVMPTSGNFTLPVAASVVVVGLPFTPKFQTLALDIEGGKGTVQGKDKKISAVTVRVQETLGLQIGSTFDNLVDMKDLALGNIGSQTNERVTNLVTGDARTVIDPKWSVPGQYCIQQSNPWPVSILGVIPEVDIGDT